MTSTRVQCWMICPLRWPHRRHRVSSVCCRQHQRTAATNRWRCRSAASSVRQGWRAWCVGIRPSIWSGKHLRRLAADSRGNRECPASTLLMRAVSIAWAMMGHCFRDFWMITVWMICSRWQGSSKNESLELIKTNTHRNTIQFIQVLQYAF